MRLIVDRATDGKSQDRQSQIARRAAAPQSIAAGMVCLCPQDHTDPLNVEEAISLLRTLDSGWAAHQIAGLLAAQGRVEEAIALLRSHAEMGDAHAAGQLADVLTEHGRVNEAIAVLMRVVR
jgi:hypothetical protein